MDTNNLQPPTPILGNGGPAGDPVANHSDDSLKCNNCGEWGEDHIRLEWEGVPFRACPGQMEDLDTYTSRADANRNHAVVELGGPHIDEALYSRIQ